VNCPECAANEDRLFSLSEYGDQVKSLACTVCGYWWHLERNLAGDWVPAG
jgi:Zn ribbon nucleic-acid-binding protein